MQEVNITRDGLIVSIDAIGKYAFSESGYVRKYTFYYDGLGNVTISVEYQPGLFRHVTLPITSVKIESVYCLDFDDMESKLSDRLYYNETPP